MFEGVAPEQFHQFILATNPSTTTIPPPPPSSSTTSSSSSLSPSPHLPLHLSFTSPNPSQSQSPSPSPAAAAAIFPITCFDPYQVPQPPPPFFHPLNNTTTIKNHHHEDRELMAAFVIPHHHHHQQKQQKVVILDHHDHHQAWSNEEVLALLRIRSSMELNWFPADQFIWEHVSRKLSEVGFKRSPEKCREKFEEETRFLNSIHHNTNHNHHTYFPNHDANGCINQQQNKYDHHDSAEIVPAAAKQEEKKDHHQDRNDDEEDNTEEDNVDPSNCYNKNINNTTTYASELPAIENDPTHTGTTKKRKRRLEEEEEEEEEEEKFEMFKGLCQEIVDKMMATQEEMQNKLIEDMVKRDQEKLAWEEAWKKREMDRINHELQLRADEQALAGDRQASIIKFLENFTNSAAPPPQQPELDYRLEKVPVVIGNSDDDNSHNGNRNSASSSTTTSSAANLNTTNNSSADELSQLDPGAVTVVNRSNNRTVPPNSSRNPRKSVVANSAAVGGELEENGGVRSSAAAAGKEEVGKRWPRDEVLALINLRCGIHNNNNGAAGSSEGEGSTTAAAGSNSNNNKAPLWERISRGMAELGYRRSAKRCKEKWENINKYFRKTKDLNKKRSADSRTCPYFHQLSSLYGAASPAVNQPPASEEEGEEGTKAGTGGGNNNNNMAAAAGNGSTSAAGIVAPGTGAAASFEYEF